MNYSVDNRVYILEENLKKIVNKIVKKNLFNYDENIKHLIDSENIFTSLFPKSNLEDLNNLKIMGEYINPSIVNGDYVKVITEEKYFEYLMRIMLKMSSEEENPYLNPKVNKCYEDVLIAIYNDIEKTRFPYIKKFYEYSIFDYMDNYKSNVMSVFLGGDYEQGRRIYEKTNFRSDVFNSLKLDIKNKKWDIVESYFNNYIKTIPNIFLDISRIKYNVKSNKNLRESPDELAFYQKTIISSFESLVSFVAEKMPSGLKDNFFNNIQLKIHQEVNRFTNFDVEKVNLKEFLDMCNDIFNKYRDKKQYIDLGSHIFETPPSLNGLKIDIKTLNISSIKADMKLLNLINLISDEVFRSQNENERFLFKSMRTKVSDGEISVLFNFKDDIPLIEKENLLNNFENLILDYIESYFNKKSWYLTDRYTLEDNSLRDKEFLRRFIDMNSEYYLRIKISDIEKAPEIKVKKKKI